LMEHFQWISPEQSRQVADDPDRLADVADELADVLCYALAMANELGLDLSAAIRGKMAKNEQKYPAEEYRGRYGPEDQANK
jgi:NTP pyrophosphatase (non-canonical NTP hydrolase)